MHSTAYATTGLQTHLLLESRQIPIPPPVARAVVPSPFLLCSSACFTATSLHLWAAFSWPCIFKESFWISLQFKAKIGEQKSLSPGGFRPRGPCRLTYPSAEGHPSHAERPRGKHRHETLATAMHQEPLLTVASRQAACHLTAVPPVHWKCWQLRQQHPVRQSLRRGKSRSYPDAKNQRTALAPGTAHIRKCFSVIPVSLGVRELLT